VALLALAQLAFTLAVGGDWMPAGRFYAPAAPLLLVLWASGASALASGATARLPLTPAARRVVVATLALATATVIGVRWWFALDPWLDRVVRPIAAADERTLTALAEDLNRVAAPTDIVAAADVGRLGYLFRGEVLDWWGLANPEIAAAGQAWGHVQPEMILRHRPRFLVLYSTEPFLDPSTMGWGLAVTSRPFYEDPAFRQGYRLRRALFYSPGRYHLVFERVAP
jgi:hypothetical protein